LMISINLYSFWSFSMYFSCKWAASSGTQYNILIKLVENNSERCFRRFNTKVDWYFKPKKILLNKITTLHIFNKKIIYYALEGVL
jgi:hypothetical protein